MNHHHGNKNNKVTSNNIKNKKDIKDLISASSATKEPSFAEEVRLMYE